jgi:bifunctional non-homologous end joining protein LigD
VPLPLIAPMLAVTGEPSGDPALFCSEVKWDGWRAVMYVDRGLRVRTRTGRQVSDCLPELAGLVDALDGHTVILDGELVACPDGVGKSGSSYTSFKRVWSPQHVTAARL